MPPPDPRLAEMYGPFGKSGQVYLWTVTPSVPPPAVYIHLGRKKTSSAAVSLSPTPLVRWRLSGRRLSPSLGSNCQAGAGAAAAATAGALHPEESPAVVQSGDDRQQPLVWLLLIESQDATASTMPTTPTPPMRVPCNVRALLQSLFTWCCQARGTSNALVAPLPRRERTWWRGHHREAESTRAVK